MPKEYIDINPLEEALTAIGIVHGKDVEQQWRQVVWTIQNEEYRRWLKQFQVCDEND